VDDPTNAALLFVRLQLVAPDARSFLLATTDPARSAVKIAADLAEAIKAAGQHVHWLYLGEAAESSDPADNAEELSLDPTIFSDIPRLRAALAQVSGYVVVAGGSLLHDARTLIAAATTDSVIVATWKGATSRLDLERARVEVERAGGKITGAILLG
jgi:hypothetical protein